MGVTSTFFGLTIGASGLNTYQAAINTTANNIANVQTEGYSRQQVLREASQAMRTHTGYGTLGTGVTATAIEQVRDFYYDLKYWNNNTLYNEYKTKQYYLDQIETYFKDDDTVDGFSTIFSNMYTALESIRTNASEYSIRQNYVGTCQSLCTYFNNMANNLSTLQEEINSVIYTDVEAINTIAEKIANINGKINLIEVTGENANELRDERALLVDELSQYVDVEVEEKVVNEELGTTSYDVWINGARLVSTRDFNTLVCVARENRVNQSDADGLYDIFWCDSTGAATSTGFHPTISSAGGELSSLFFMRDGNNKSYFNGMIDDAFGSYTYTDQYGNVTSNCTIVTIDDPSLTDLTEITVPTTGTLNLNGRFYDYDGFELNYDGTNYTYTFYLTSEISSDIQSTIAGKTGRIGNSVNYMGIPYYQSQLNGFLREYASAYNAIQKSGQDLYGDTGIAFYNAEDSDLGTIYSFGDAWDETTIGTLINTYNDRTNGYDNSNDTYYNLTAAEVKVSDSLVADANLVVAATSVTDGPDASDLIDKLYKLCISDSVFRNTTANSFLQCIISDVSVDSQEAKTFATSYENALNNVISQRTSVSGVDEDEEALDLVKFQNAYNLSSKLIQTLSEMYDKLVQETGV